MKTFWEWLEFDLMEGPQYISAKDYEDRLESLGWRIVPGGASHRTAYSPDGVGKVTWTVNNWDKNWHQVARDLLRFALGGRGVAGGYKDLEFVWHNPFKIPGGFNYSTQEVESGGGREERVLVSRLLSNPEVLADKEVEQGGEWKRVEMADHGSDGTSVEVLFDDGTAARFGMSQTITIRVAA